MSFKSVESIDSIIMCSTYWALESLSNFNLASLFANRKPSEGFCYNESLSFYLIKGQYYAVKNLAYSFFNC